MKRVVEMLDEHLGTPLRVRDLARLVGLGASRLEHLFKEEARISIRDYLRDRRLTAAAAMLESTEERVSVISFQVGFQHVANFNHAFKKRYGISPRRYREQRNTDSIQAE